MDLDFIKKFFFLLLVFFVLSFPVLVFADVIDSLVSCGEPGNPCTICHFVTLVNNVVKFLTLSIILPASVLGIIISGIAILTAAGNQSRIEKGRKALIYILIGIAITFAAWLIVDTILRAVLKEDFGPWNTFPSCGSGANPPPDLITPPDGEPIVIEPPCSPPDGKCGIIEDCLNCPQDCGECDWGGGPDPTNPLPSISPSGGPGPGECFADTYEGPSAGQYDSVYSLSGRSIIDGQEVLMTSFFDWPAYNPEYIKQHMDWNFYPRADIGVSLDTRYNIWESEGGHSLYVGQNGIPADMRLFIPPGVTSATITYFGGQGDQYTSTNFGVATRFLRPPDFSENMASAQEIYALTQGSPEVNLGSMADKDSFTQLQGGTATVMSQYLSEPLESGGWLYLHTFEEAGASPNIFGLQFVLQVDIEKYEEWYNNAKNDPDNIGNDPGPILGPSTDDCE